MSIRQLLLALIALSLVASFARAQEETAEEVPLGEDSEEAIEEEERDPNAIYGVFGRAIFDGQDLLGVPRFPAGEKVYTTIGFSNDAKNPTYDVFFISAHITRLGDHLNHFQNFSGVRHDRAVARGETATFRYTFTPHEALEPMEYNLVVRMFFRNDNNQTFAAVAYNSTIIVEEPLGTDPKTIMTFLTIGAIIAAVAYVINVRRPKTTKPRVKKVEPEVSGTSTAAFDPEYISKEHLNFREALLNRKSSSSPVKRR
jgi:translocon-associated protein subunit alpha